MSALTLRRYKVVPGRNYDTPKEVWGFRLPPSSLPPEDTARRALDANAELLGLTGVQRYLRCRHVRPSVGAYHAILSQHHEGLRVHRAYVTVHMSRDRAAYLIKNRAVPKPLLPTKAPFELSAREARRAALATVAANGREFRVLGDPEPLWYPVRTRLRPAYKLRLHGSRPLREWIIYVDATNGNILSKYDNLANAVGYARVFDPNPVVALGNSSTLLSGGEPVRPPKDAYRVVRLTGLNQSGRLDGTRVTTSLTSQRVRRSDRQFKFDSHQRGFDEAMVYYHVNEAIAYLESLGYRGQRAIFRKPLRANAHGTREDNSWYSPGLRTLTFGTGGVDDAEDGETIVHEFGHALQDAICPDFGQSLEAAAMGEGFGDYFAGSVFAAKKVDAGHDHLVPALMTWDGIQFDASQPPPCVRRLDGRLTYESFNHKPTADEHDNGEIWSATLWDIWQTVGRDTADRIIIESHFQLDGFTTFARGARAILDADRNLFNGRHVTRLKKVFHKRGIGPVE